MFTRIKLNANYVRLAHRKFKESEEYKDRDFDIPTEVYMRRKELLDDIHTTIEIVEPGLTRRRGKFWIVLYTGASLFPVLVFAI